MLNMPAELYDKVAAIAGQNICSANVEEAIITGVRAMVGASENTLRSQSLFDPMSRMRCAVLRNLPAQDRGFESSPSPVIAAKASTRSPISC